VIKQGKIICSGHVACTEELRNAYTTLVEKLEGKRPFGRPRRRWEHNITTDFKRA